MGNDVYIGLTGKDSIMGREIQEDKVSCRGRSTEAGALQQGFNPGAMRISIPTCRDNATLGSLNNSCGLPYCFVLVTFVVSKPFAPASVSRWENRAGSICGVRERIQR